MLIIKKSSEDQPRKNRGCLWTALILIAVYAALCACMGASMGSMFSTPATKLSDNTIYRLKMEGMVVEQAPEDNPFAGLMSSMSMMPGMAQQETVGLDNLLSNIRLAKEDKHVLGIYLDGGNLIIGQSQAKVLREALVDFKTSGKFIVAYAPSYTLSNYYIATAADHIYLNFTGSVDWKGLCASKMYYTRLMEKIGVKVQILKVGTFKSAVEPFFCTSMSEADREQTMTYLTGVWNIYKQGVSEGRNIPVDQLDKYADEVLSVTATENYVNYGLVDSLIYVQDMDTILCHLAATKDYELLSTSKMAAVKRHENKCDDKIAVVYAEGEIVNDAPQGISGVKMVKTLKKVLNDDEVRAVVLRVNSPGGSADASEQIWHALRLLQQKGLPVVVSMSDMAASGGYYISCMGDYIFAQPNTLTGSIGIFGMIPCWNDLREKVGLDIDGVGTNAQSGMFNDMILRGMSTEQHAIMQSMVERGYDLFTSRCAEGRHMPQSEIKRIGEGRVWLGQDALRLGLVDELGGIDEAIAKAAELAELEKYQLKFYPAKKNPMEDLLSMFDDSTEEEKIVAKLRHIMAKPRILALMPEVQFN